MLSSAAIVLGLLAGAHHAAAQSTTSATGTSESYLNQVCYPATTNANDTVPPCVAITSIETTCQPNGTDALYLIAHQECMCGGSYFYEWAACQDCLVYHGFESAAAKTYWLGVLSVVSSSLCGVATPVAPFQSLFTSAQATIAALSGAATATSDQAVSQTAVSLYFTATRSLGPGAITGSAASATATAKTTTTSSRTGTTTSAPSGTGTTTGAGSKTTTTSTTSSGSSLTLGSGAWVWAVMLVGSALVL